MKTLELKDLKYYLGTDIIVLDEKHWIKSIMTVLGSGGRNSSDSINSVIEGVFKPCFLPLSALTEQLPDGSIPIVVLAEMATNEKMSIYFINDAIKNNPSSNGAYSASFGDKFFSFYPKSMCFLFGGYSDVIRDIDGGKTMSFENYEINQLQLFEYLYQNHFWLGDQSLFETGEIIDKRTLK